MGRPLTLDMDVVARVCKELEKGRPLKAICRDEGMPEEGTFRRWESERPEVSALSMPARAIGCHSLADECIDIADDSSNDWIPDGDDGAMRPNPETVQRSRLRIDTRMRLLGKWLPKVYGDRLELGGTLNLSLEDRLQRAEARARESGGS